MIQVLQSKGLVRENFYLPTVFEYVEKLFLQRFVLIRRKLLSCCNFTRKKMDLTE